MFKLALEDLKKVLKRCPEKGSAETKIVEGQGGTSVIVPSFGPSGMSYKVTIVARDGGWSAECSCKGWKKMVKEGEPVKPCVHIAYQLRELPAFDLDKEVARAAIEAEAGKGHGSPEGTQQDDAPKYEVPYTGPLGPDEEGAQAPASPAPEETVQPEREGAPPLPPEPEKEPVEEKPAAPDPEPTPEPKSRAEASKELAPRDGANVRRIWPSSLPMKEACPASAWGPAGEVEIRTTGIPAKIGTAVHAILKDIVAQKLEAVPDVTPYAVKFGIEDEVESLRFLSYFGMQAWIGSEHAAGLSQFFAQPLTEQHLYHTIKAVNPYTGDLTELLFSGKADVLGYSGPSPTSPPTRASVLDWKSGRKHDVNDYMAQMLGMAFEAAAQHPTIEEVSTILVWLRDQTYTTAIFTRAELRKWALRFVKYTAFWDGKTYGPGPHCRYCPRVAACPGRQAHLASLISPLAGSKLSSASLLYDEQGHLRPTEEVYKAYQNAKTLQGLCYSFFDLLKMELKTTGPLAIPSLDGQALGVKPRAGITHIDLAKAKAQIQEYVSEEKLLSISKVGKTALKQAVYDVSEKGSKKANFDALLESLFSIGAAKKEPDTQVLSVVKAVELKPALEEGE